MPLLTKNMGGADRVARFVLALIFAVTAFVVEGLVPTVAFVALSVFTVLEGALSWCALYALIGIKTCPVKK